MSKPRVAVAMSGGVDSSVTAALLKKQGFDIFGITMILAYREGHDCLEQDVEDAQKAAATLGIPHHTIRIESEFKTQVVDYFVQEYTQGRTPNPCARCNPRIKFGYFLEKALELGADKFATGHYAIIEQDENSGRYLLKAGLEKNKDQSYFLARLDQKALSHILFPIGLYSKDHIRKLASKFNLEVAQKSDSQEICFIPDENVMRFLQYEIGKTYPQGPIIDEKGNQVGMHQGIIRYTIGQRKGLGIALGKPVYITQIDAATNTIYIGPEELLYHDTMLVSSPNYIAKEKLDDTVQANVRIRHNHKPAPAVISQVSENILKIAFETPQRAITPGQLAAFYQDDILLGSAWIDKILPQD